MYPFNEFVILSSLHSFYTSTYIVTIARLPCGKHGGCAENTKQKVAKLGVMLPVQQQGAD
jgi:hypothetical protein